MKSLVTPRRIGVLKFTKANLPRPFFAARPTFKPERIQTQLLIVRKMTTARAIVAHAPLKEKGWKMQNVQLPGIGEDQMLVKMVASGVCHTDLNFGNIPPGEPGAMYPKVFGHEGAGYVEKVGSKVKVAAVGDPVLLSFNSCGKCRMCHDDHPAHCNDFTPMNFIGRNTFATKSADDLDITGSFFGQSSFSSYSVVDERSAVNVKGLIDGDDDLIKLSPLGCGIQTGTGTVINVARASEKDTVAILGLGGVGLSGIMAAKIAKAKVIIGIDRVESRLELAKELGATHTINTAKFDLADLTELKDAIKQVDQDGPTITIDTTGVLPLLQSAYEFTRSRGQVITLGMVPPDAKMNIGITDMEITGKMFLGVLEGDVVPEVWVPKMIRWWKEGEMPFDKLIKIYKADNFEEALHEMHSGKTVKPIIVW